MASHDTHTLYLAAAIITPVAVMFGAQFVGNGPARASADIIGIELPSLGRFATLDATPTDGMESASQPLQTDSIKSPFWFDEVFVSQNPQIYQDPSPTSRPQEQEPLPVVEVSSILPSSRNSLAVINGKPCKIGDLIEGETQWKLLSIDGQARTVTLMHASGRRMTVRLKILP